MATGVLVLGVNRATRLLGHLMLTEKTYLATVRLGLSTSTDDAEGETTSTASTVAITEEMVLAVVEKYAGDIEQVPTAVTAIKIEGKRAYHHVSDVGRDDRPARRVTCREISAARDSMERRQHGKA